MTSQHALKRLRPDLDTTALREFCHRWRVQELSLFGSILRTDFNDESDVDILVSFDSDAAWSLLDHERMRLGLEEILGRTVDLVTKRSIMDSHNWLRRREILKAAVRLDVA